MSRKDYERFASILEDCPKEIEGAAREWIAVQMAKAFRADNSRFSPLRFFMAAGFDDSQAGEMVQKV